MNFIRTVRSCISELFCGAGVSSGNKDEEKSDTVSIASIACDVPNSSENKIHKGIQPQNSLQRTKVDSNKTAGNTITLPSNSDITGFGVTHYNVSNSAENKTHKRIRQSSLEHPTAGSKYDESNKSTGNTTTLHISEFRVANNEVPNSSEVTIYNRLQPLSSLQSTKDDSNKTAGNSIILPSNSDVTGFGVTHYNASSSAENKIHKRIRQSSLEHPTAGSKYDESNKSTGNTTTLHISEFRVANNEVPNSFEDNIYNRLQPLSSLQSTKVYSNKTAGNITNLFSNYSVNTFRKQSVYPTKDDLVETKIGNLKPNIIQGQYETLDNYLSTHFTLLREDFIKPLREDLKLYFCGNKTLDNIVIHNITFIRRGIKNDEYIFCIQLTKALTTSLSDNEDSEKSLKRFMTGSLVIFTRNNFEDFFCGRVSNNDGFRNKLLSINFESNTLNQICCKPDIEYKMIECNAFFEPYYNVLTVLQKVYSSTISMENYLVQVESNIKMPKYLKGIKQHVLINGLNPSQHTTLNAVLSQELAIVQGPPGTGKTFMGIEITNQLLKRSSLWYNNTPMLILSRTNHALDNFLERVTKYTLEILRYGSQSKSPSMKNYLFPERRKAFYERAPHRKRQVGPLFRNYMNLKEQINRIEKKIDSIRINRHIFNLKELTSKIQGVPKSLCESDELDLMCWLLEDDDTVRNDNFKRLSLDDINKVNLFFKNDEKMNQDFMKIFVKAIVKFAPTNMIDIIGRIVKGDQKYNPDYLNVYKYLLNKIHYLENGLKKKAKTSCQRWRLYYTMLEKYESILVEELEPLTELCIKEYKKLKDVQNQINVEIMRTQKVIGMTTTVAARMYSTIKELKCPIVIVEEAAEVLESHIIPVLTEHCQHLILLGDHLQLKPSTTDYTIETDYNLGVSLFERMVNNNIPYHTLNVQYRMRPEISSLITPSIYPELTNHESVEQFPSVRGFGKNMYFINHDNLENDANNTSKENTYEAKFLIRLAAYLLQNQYEPKDITILATYLGQVEVLRKERKKFHKNDDLQNIQITSVDNFQGEENKIILLSLVRNNTENKIGFLSIENRACVALSRAKEGFYVMGNMAQLSRKSKLWRNIGMTFKRFKAIGKNLPLKCHKHSGETEIKNVGDFDKLLSKNICEIVCQKKSHQHR